MNETAIACLFMSFIALVLGFMSLMEAIERRNFLVFIPAVIFFYTSMLFAAIGVGVILHG